MKNTQIPARKLPNMRLQHERELNGWSQEYVAEKIGTTAKNVSRWERGDNKPVPYFREKLIKLFGKNAEELGFLDEATDHDSQEECPEKAGIPQESPSTPLVKSINLDGHQPIQLFIPNSTPHIVAIHIHQQAPFFSSTYPYDMIYGGIQNTIGQRNLEEMPQSQDGKISRREAIGGLLTAIPFLSFKRVAHLLHDEEILSVCATNIPILWRLYFEGSRTEVAQILPEYTSQLSMLAQPPYHYQTKAASFASQVYQLASSLSLHRQDFGTALEYAKWAFLYGEQAEDCNLQTASLIRQAMILLDLNRIGPRLEAYQRALLHIENSSPLLQSRVYLGLAEAYSRIGQEQDALRHIGLARDNFPDCPKDDPNFAYTHFDHWSLWEYTGLMYLNLKQASNAWKSFSKADNDTIIPASLVSKRLRLFTTQATASFAMGDLDLCYQNVEAAATAALTIGSHLRYNEAYNLYAQMAEKWPHERKLKQLEKLFTSLGQVPF